MLQIEVNTSSKGILADKMGYRKIRYLIFWKFVANIISRFNVEGNIFAIKVCY